MIAFSYSNQWKIFREITALKFQGKHAAQFNFCRYEGLCPPTKHKSAASVSDEILQNFRTATLENNFWGCFWKENRGRKGYTVTIALSGFHFFQASFLFIKSWNNVLSPQIFA